MWLMEEIMKNKVDNLLEDCLNHLGFLPCPCKDNVNIEGTCYELPHDLGEGYYWYYEREGMFAIGMIDIRFKKDKVIAYKQQDFISISYYDTIFAEELAPYKRLNANCIRGHVSNHQIYRAKYHKNVPIRGIELILMPGYYHDYLKQKYPNEFLDYKNAFLSIDGINDFPQLVLLMRQLQNFKGTGLAAHLFYESKVSEALSLIIDKSIKSKNIISHNELSKEDLVNLDAVKSYINDHFAFNIKTDTLTKIACMGQTKLRNSFKKCYGYTITQYIQNKRIAHGEYLLVATDFTIKQIAQSVGYHHAGRFAALFQKNTGLYPDEYRNIMKKSNN